MYLCLRMHTEIVKFISHGAARLEDQLVTSQLHVSTNILSFALLIISLLFRI